MDPDLIYGAKSSRPRRFVAKVDGERYFVVNMNHLAPQLLRKYWGSKNVSVAVHMAFPNRVELRKPRHDLIDLWDVIVRHALLLKHHYELDDYIWRHRNCDENGEELSETLRDVSNERSVQTLRIQVLYDGILGD